MALSRSERRRRLYRRRRQFINEQKTGPCSRCGGTFPAVCLDFHHRDPGEKLFRIAVGIHHSREGVLAEIAKCDLICANCHRILTQGV